MTPTYGHFAKGPFGEGYMMTGMPFYLNRHTAHRAEALDFLRFMSSQEGSTIFTNVSNWLPVVIGAVSSWEFSAQFQIWPNGYNWYGESPVRSSHIDPQYFFLNSVNTLCARMAASRRSRRCCRTACPPRCATTTTT